MHKEERIMEYLRIETRHEAYGPDDIKGTMTVGELKALLEDYPEDFPVIISFDNGYTYGGIGYSDIIEDSYGKGE